MKKKFKKAKNHIQRFKKETLVFRKRKKEHKKPTFTFLNVLFSRK